MIKSFVKNCGNPEGIIGNIVLGSMNSSHGPLCDWMMECVKWEDGAHVLDVGCGGGATIARMFTKYPSSHIDGVDYSETSVEKSKIVNKDKLGVKCNIQQGNVMNLPYSNNTYNVVTAMNTIYFWPNPVTGCKQIRRVLKKNGKIVIICGMNDKKWSKYNKDMIIYTTDELMQILEKSGFKDIEVHTKKGWVCIEGTK